MRRYNYIFDGTLKAGHDFTYKYDPKDPFRLLSVDAKEYRSSTEEVDTTRREHSYAFDGNGNLVLQLSDLVERIDSASFADTAAMQVRQYLWDEDNHLLAINDNGFVSNYFYDAAGERTVKISAPDLAVFVNGAEALKNDSALVKFVGYVSPYLVVSNGGRYTKHIYAGTQRIASKVGDIEAFGADPRREEYAGANLKEVDFGEIYDTQTKALLARYDSLGVMNKPRELNDYVGGQSFCCGEKELVSNNQTGDNTFETPDYEHLIFFYHPDHLGSTALVTDNDGNVVQSVAYIPYGEVFIEERNGTWNTPYLFNGKELDEETGLYYYGARYLNPTNGMWLSVDPMFEDYKGVSPYAYCMGNPVKHVDVEGEFPILANLVGAAVGAATEYGSQVISNFFDEDVNGVDCFTNVDYCDIAVAAGEGFLTCGASTGKTIVVKIGSAVVKNAVDVRKDGDRGVQPKTNKVGEVVVNTAYDLTAGALIDCTGKGVKALAKVKDIELEVMPVYQSKNKRNEVFKEKYKSKYGVNPSMKEIKAYNKANDFKIEKNRNKATNKAVNEQINGYFEAQPGVLINAKIKEYFKDNDK